VSLAGVSLARVSLAADLQAAGVPRGDLLVHVSMREIGSPPGGPATLFGALREVAGPAATIVVPTHTAHNSTSSPAFRLATLGMDDTERADYLRRMPGFTPDMPSHGCGVFAEYVRRLPGAVRSAHPQTSFAAVGPQATELMAVHDLDCHLGERSPVGALYRAGGHELLIGCGWERCTGLHLAECRVPRPRLRRYTCFVMAGGRRIRKDFTDIDHTDEVFPEIGAAFEKINPVAAGPLGRGRVTVVPIRAAVHFAVRWLTEFRSS
jgi:aminoglycoside 3-N-acetyltransferase